MRNLWRSSALLLLAGCAAGGNATPSDAPTPPPRISSVGNGYDVRIESGGATSAVALQAAPEAAWTALLAAYQSMGIPLSTVDAAQRTASAVDLEVRRRLAGKSLSEFLDCGSNLTGLIANSYRVRLTVSSTLKPDAQGGSTLQTSVSASATSPQGASSAPVNCATTGRLEEEIARRVRAGGGA
jgi:hypothetical protein